MWRFTTWLSRPSLAASLLIALTLAAGTLAAGGAHAADGMGFLSGKVKLKVNRCGKEKEMLLVNVRLRSDSSWDAIHDESLFVSGTYTESRNGRKLNLSLSSASHTALIDSVADWASDICGGFVTVTNVVVKRLNVKINKRQTRAKLSVKITGEGFTSTGSGKATFTGKAKGLYTPFI